MLLSLQAQLYRLLEPGSQPRGLQALWIEGQDSPCSVTDHSTVLAAHSISSTSLHGLWELCPGECPALHPQGILLPICWSCLGFPVTLSPCVKAVRGKLPPFPQDFPNLRLCHSGRTVTGIPWQKFCSARTFSPTSPHSLPCPVASGLAGASQHHGAFPCHSVLSRGSGS